MLAKFKLSQRKIWLAVLLTFIFTPLGYIYTRGWKGLYPFFVLIVSVMTLSGITVTILDADEITSEKIGHAIGSIGWIIAMVDNGMVISKAKKEIDKIS